MNIYYLKINLYGTLFYDKYTTKLWNNVTMNCLWIPTRSEKPSYNPTSTIWHKELFLCCFGTICCWYVCIYLWILNSQYLWFVLNVLKGKPSAITRNNCLDVNLNGLSLLHNLNWTKIQVLQKDLILRP